MIQDKKKNLCKEMALVKIYKRLVRNDIRKKHKEITCGKKARK